MFLNIFATSEKGEGKDDNTKCAPDKDQNCVLEQLTHHNKGDSPSQTVDNGIIHVMQDPDANVKMIWKSREVSFVSLFSLKEQTLFTVRDCFKHHGLHDHVDVKGTNQ